MDGESLALLELLKRSCGRSYKLVPIGEIPEALDNVTEDKIKKELDILSAEGYLDIKYRDDSVFLCKVTPLGFTVKGEERLESDGSAKWQVKPIRIFVAAFFGSLLSGAILMALAAVMRYAL